MESPMFNAFMALVTKYCNVKTAFMQALSWKASDFSSDSILFKGLLRRLSKGDALLEDPGIRGLFLANNAWLKLFKNFLRQGAFRSELTDFDINLYFSQCAINCWEGAKFTGTLMEDIYSFGRDFSTIPSRNSLFFAVGASSTESYSKMWEVFCDVYADENLYQSSSNLELVAGLGAQCTNQVSFELNADETNTSVIEHNLYEFIDRPSRFLICCDHYNNQEVARPRFFQITEPKEEKYPAYLLYGYSPYLKKLRISLSGFGYYTMSRTTFKGTNSDARRIKYFTYDNVSEFEQSCWTSNLYRKQFYLEIDPVLSMHNIEPYNLNWERVYYWQEQGKLEQIKDLVLESYEKQSLSPLSKGLEFVRHSFSALSFVKGQMHQCKTVAVPLAMDLAKTWVGSVVKQNTSVKYIDDRRFIPDFSFLAQEGLVSHGVMQGCFKTGGRLRLFNYLPCKIRVLGPVAIESEQFKSSIKSGVDPSRFLIRKPYARLVTANEVKQLKIPKEQIIDQVFTVINFNRNNDFSYIDHGLSSALSISHIQASNNLEQATNLLDFA